MPLPKSSSMAARATEVYTETWSAVLGHCWDIEPIREDDVRDLYLLLPYLRQLLTCCACAGLLDQAMVSLSCGHCYCYECQYKTPLLKIQCRQCRERTGLVTENQLRLVVQAYKEMCHVLWEELKDRPVLPTTNKGDPVKGKEGNEIGRKSSHAQVDLASETVFDPITEILQEVRLGTKVSRAVLIVKPPLKYINSKGFVTPRKEPPASSSNTAKGDSPPSPQPDKVSTPTKTENEIDIPETPRQSKVDSIVKDGATKVKTSSPKSKTAEKNSRTTTTAAAVGSSSHHKSKKSKKQKSKSSSSSLHQKVDDSSWVRVEACGATSSEEDIDIMNVVEYSPMEFQQEKFNASAFPSEKLEISKQSLRPEFFDIGESTVAFKSNAARVPLKVDGREDCKNEMVRVGSTSRKRSRNPFTPRVGMKKIRVEKCVWASTQQTFLCTPGFPVSGGRPRQRQTFYGRENSFAMRHSFPPVPLFIPERGGSELPPRMFPYPSPPLHPPPPYTPPRSSPPHPPRTGGYPLLPPPHPPPPPPPHSQHHPHRSRMHFAPPVLMSTAPPRSNFVGHPIMIPSNANPALPITMMMAPPTQQHTLPPPQPPLPSMFLPPASTRSSPQESPPSTEKKGKRSFLHGVWRCRCGTNNVMHPEKVCARAKCPCFSKGKACEKCLCRNCNNPYKEASSSK